MKKRLFFGLLAMTLVFTLAFIGCGDGSDNGGNGGDNGTDIITDGRLTITGLSEHNGKYVDANNSGNPYLMAFGSYLKGSGSFYDSKSKTGGLVTNGSVTLKVYIMSTGKAENYTGNDTGVKFGIWSYPSENSNTGTPLPGGITVNFSNGVGSGTYNPNLF